MSNLPACGAPLLLLAACLSSAPPAPPVRWFDPLPAPVAETGARRVVDLRVTAADHLGREFVVRTGPREVVFDDQHGWIDEPGGLVATALAARFTPSRSAPPLEVAVAAFELDVQATPRAVVRLLVRWQGAERPVVGERAAPDRAPAALAEAMAGALDDAAGAVAAFVRGD